jgi:hypothetical protein
MKAVSRYSIELLKGESHPNARLTDEKVRDILQRLPTVRTKHRMPGGTVSSDSPFIELPVETVGHTSTGQAASTSGRVALERN